MIVVPAKAGTPRINVVPAKAGTQPFGRQRGARTSRCRNMKQPAVYILASGKNGTLYVGVTSNLASRVEAHRSGAVGGFTRKYHVERLVYFELHEEMIGAIQREKRLKKWNRAWKIALIERSNPDWRDLSDQAG
jgi:putative endonuclease